MAVSGDRPTSVDLIAIETFPFLFWGQVNSDQFQTFL